jgi:hypothetical protein
MNPLLQEALGSILRKLLTVAATWLVAQGYWTDTAAQQYVAAATLALLSVGWSLWTNYRKRLKIVTALAMPAETSERELIAQIKTGDVPPATVSKDAAPYMPTEKVEGQTPGWDSRKRKPDHEDDAA